jgi:hypothetical protein
MKLSILERLLTVGRHRPHLHPEVLDFAPPVAMQYPTTHDEGPWVTSLSKGRFTRTRANLEGYVGQAFHTCPIEEEDRLFANFYEDLWKISSEAGWSNRCISIEDAFRQMNGTGYEGRVLVVPYASLREAVGKDLSEEEAEQISLAKGCVAEVQGVKVISARSSLPVGSAVLATVKSLTGYYTRVRDHVGVTILHADRSLILVGHEVA